MIPLNDLSAEYRSMKEEIDLAIKEVIESGQFIGGKKLEEFEKNFARFCGQNHCIGASNGSTALYAVLKCLGIGEGDEVIVPVNTFIATAFAVSFTGATPIFVDVKENALVDVDLINEAITNKTKAIIPVHLYGNVCDMDKIFDIAKQNKLYVIEDCAQAHGSKYKDKKVPIGDIGCFSFFPAKNLGAFGDAGAIVTNNEDLSILCRKFVNHGRAQKYFHDSQGFNYRLDPLQAAILDVKLKHLEESIRKKNHIANKYDENLSKEYKIIGSNKDAYHSYHLYVIRNEKRDQLQKFLNEKGIQTGIHYPLPLHLQPVFNYLGYEEGDFPVAEKLSKEILSLPIYSELDEEKQDKIINECLNFLKNTN